MTTNLQVAAVDLGASSGRVMIGRVGPRTLTVHEAARFPNGAVRRRDGLHWDAAALREHVFDGLARAGSASAGDGGLTSVGIDTWAVDYGLLRNGLEIGEPFHYRDEQRCAVGPERVHAVLSHRELYGRNGLQYLPFNTLYQLVADSRLDMADRLLLMPDLVASWLTGVHVSERTNASTTGLLDIRTGRWDHDLLTALGLPVDLFPDLLDPGARIGTIAADAAQRTGLHGIPVVAVGSHDTASAVVGVPLAGRDAAYICSGTWGLVGLELAAPVLTEAARAANFTNEGGVDGSVRFLTNVMGTWLLSEMLRTWGTSDLSGLLAAAAQESPAVPIIDVRDDRFLPPGDMAARIGVWCAEHGIAAPASGPALVRCIVESLAVAYATALETAEALTGRAIRTVNLVGGGVLNTLLCQAVATRSGRRVVAGPVEATALGNVLIQARAAGATGPTLADLRDLVRSTQVLTEYQPA